MYGTKGSADIVLQSEKIMKFCDFFSLFFYFHSKTKFRPKKLKINIKKMKHFNSKPDTGTVFSPTARLGTLHDF